MVARYFLYRYCGTREIQFVSKEPRDFRTTSEHPRGKYNRFRKTWISRRFLWRRARRGKEVNNQDKIKSERLTLPSVVNVVPFLFDFVIPGCSERDRDEKSLFQCGRFLWDAWEENTVPRINDSNLIAITRRWEIYSDNKRGGSLGEFSTVLQDFQ